MPRRTCQPTVTPTPLDGATVAAIRAELVAAVASWMTALQSLDVEALITAWAQASQPSAGWWEAALLLPLIAFPDDPPPDARHEAALRAMPATVAPTLALLALAPGGFRFGPEHWQGSLPEPVSVRLFGYRVSDDTNVPSGLTGLHRRTIQTLRLLFPFAASELARLALPDRWAAAQATARELGPDSALFSEALVVGGTAAQMGQATQELVAVVAALACCPGGVPVFGSRWEVLGVGAASESAACPRDERTVSEPRGSQHGPHETVPA